MGHQLVAGRESPVTAILRSATLGTLVGLLSVTLLAPAAAAQTRARSTQHPTRNTSKLPPIPLKTGPLAVQVVYPGPQDVIDAGDSSFVFGEVGDGRAELTVNGQEVAVARNGAFLGWILIPADTVISLEYEATRGADTARLVQHARRTLRFTPPASGPWLDTLSVAPRGRVWWPATESLPVTLRAAPGAMVQLRMTDGRVIALSNDPRLAEVPWGTRAFETDSTKLARPVAADRYAGLLPVQRIGDPGPLFGATGAPPQRPTAPAPTIEVILGADTARWSWPIQLAPLEGAPRAVRFDDDTAREGDTDQLTVGRTAPAATYYYFFPTGTRTAVTARLNSDLRVRLSNASYAWVSAGDAIPLLPGVPTSGATVGSVRLTRAADRVAIRIPVTWRVPFKVFEEEQRLTLTFFGAQGDVNWIQYGPADPMVEQVKWQMSAGDEVSLVVDLADPVWGYRTRWEGSDLILEVKRPPHLDPARPLAGLKIVVDPGHPPVGATGPTGLKEPEANLGIAQRLVPMLRAAGATVLLTRKDSLPVDLWPRVRLADSADADLLVSIHNNALPDGVNPFTNSGTSVYYNQPRSLAWARPVEAALVRRLGIKELGVGRGDLALVRPTWMPSILTEGMFLCIPEQENALRSRAGQRLYAQAVFDGTLAFLKGRARAQTPATLRP